MNIYQSPIIKAIIHFYGDILYPNATDSIHDHLNNLANRMNEGLRQKEDCIYAQINNYHPDYLGVNKSILKNEKFDLIDCKHTIANEFSFSSWDEVRALKYEKYNIEFEDCVNMIINGQLDSLKKSIRSNPSLIHQQSQYGHNATLLHYTASNGVEFWRQQVPLNLSVIVNYLIDAGADKNAKMKVYGGYFDTLELVKSSAHPFEAGIGESIVSQLRI